jgi:hypothetical protein
LGPCNYTIEPWLSARPHLDSENDQGIPPTELFIVSWGCSSLEDSAVAPGWMPRVPDGNRLYLQTSLLAIPRGRCGGGGALSCTLIGLA